MVNHTIQQEYEKENQRICNVRLVLFDFGGVLAEEGFRNGLMAIAGDNRLDPKNFIQTAFELIFDTGYVLGRVTEAAYWDALRQETGIVGSDDALRSVILDRFLLRPGMIDLVRWLAQNGVRTAILSDQTNWLDELDRRYAFFKYFEQVFNSYHLLKSKRDPGLFDDVTAEMGVKPDQALFTDDHPGNVERASERGLNAILFKDEKQFRRDLSGYFTGILTDKKQT